MNASYRVALFVAVCGTCSAQQQSASELIRFLTFQTDRPDKLLKEMGLFSCGVPADDPDLRAATSLVQLGPSAVPSIEEELRAMQQRGDPGLGASWIEIADALIQGPAALELLRKMEADPKLGSQEQFGDNSTRRQLDRAIALSLNLSSFVSSPAAPRTRFEGGMHFMCRAPEPRDALDRLIRAFESNDDSLLESVLGPQANAAWESLQSERIWGQMRAELLDVKSGGDFAMGYQFEPSDWSEPAASLRPDHARRDTPESAILATQFKTRSGANCRSYRVDFELSSAPGQWPFRTRYVVNNADLSGLLGVIASCLTKQ